MLQPEAKMTADQEARVRAAIPFCHRTDLGDEHQMVIFLRIEEGTAIAKAYFCPTEPNWTGERLAKVHKGIREFSRAVARRIGEDVRIDYGGRSA